MLHEQYGRTAAIQFGPLALKAIRQRMVEEDLSRIYINDLAGRIKRMFKWGARFGKVPLAAWQEVSLIEPGASILAQT